MYRYSVSVIIPTFNRARHIGRAIKSALAQTFCDWELIVVDDGSTDDTEDVVHSFNDPRIRLIRHDKNYGAPAARNTGIRASKGEYICFLDSDDEWLMTKLEEQMSATKDKYGRKKDSNIVLVGGLVCDSLGNVARAYIPEKSGFLYDEFFNLKVGANGTMLVPRKCFHEVGMYDENLCALQHWDMSVRLAAKYEYVALPKLLVKAYIHGEARITTAANRIKALEYLLLKYAPVLERYPRGGAVLRLNLGLLKLRSGFRSEARREFISSLRLYPYILGAYAYLLASVLGMTELPWRRKKKIII
jgi:glycosyltransferase involved in cell wall biosynthesis